MVVHVLEKTVHRSCMGRAWLQAMHRACIEHVQNIARIMHRPYKDNLQVSAHIVYAPTIHEPCIDHTKAIHRPCTGHYTDNNNTHTVNRTCIYNIHSMHETCKNHTKAMYRSLQG